MSGGSVLGYKFKTGEVVDFCVFVVWLICFILIVCQIFVWIYLLKGDYVSRVEYVKYSQVRCVLNYRNLSCLEINLFM